jgi:hypothetical protein
VARSYGSHCLILLPEYTTRSIVCVHLSYRSRLRPGLPLCVGQVFFCDTVIQASRLYPRGPRSGQGYSVPVPHHLLTSSEPLKDTPRFPGLAGYTRSLGCAGAPRPPMSGSELSLTNPCQHAALYDHGEPAGSVYPVPSPAAQPSSPEDRFGVLIYPLQSATSGWTFRG